MAAVVFHDLFALHQANAGASKGIAAIKALENYKDMFCIKELKAYAVTGYRRSTFLFTAWAIGIQLPAF